MKYKRSLSGWYTSEDGRWRIQNYKGIWEIYLDGKYWSYSNSLKSAKEKIETGKKA